MKADPVDVGSEASSKGASVLSDRSRLGREPEILTARDRKLDAVRERRRLAREANRATN